MNTALRANAELTGQIVVVTGAAQGLGLGIAKELAARGARVVIADLQQEKAAAAADSLAETGLSVVATQVDISDSDSVDRCFARLVDAHGRIDVLVNNAGVGQHVAPIVALADQEWQRVINVTLTGTFYCCRAAGRIMEQQAAGAIVNIASINGQNPAALVAAYNVAKAGVISLTRTLALELAAYGVRVNAVCPGPVYTDFNKTVMAERCLSLGLTEQQMIERVRSAIPLGRWGEAADIAAVVAFLCGPQSSWMTGEVLRVSGGLEGVSAAPPKRS
ncbi:MAG: SDR family oxidoreductase [Planctomycetales bacterium]|nr:SDR family oxidoreductase [Planctomycetales bacterium]